jgi:tRNA(Ile)-lysidine synthase
MIEPGDRIVVALSGGPDSVALAIALDELRQKPSADYSIALAHLNHCMRNGSNHDEAFCHRFAGKRGLNLVTARIDVTDEARHTKRSLEEAARLARYRFLEQTAARLGCNKIALGHTKNDQAETLLLRLFRGAAATGLGAMRPVVNNRLIRPLLDIERDTVIDFLRRRRAAYKLDPTNEDRSIARNRVRHEALPLLEQSFNPSLIDTLCRTAQVLRDEDDWMEELACRTLETLAMAGDSKDGLQIPVETLSNLHPAHARRVLRRALRTTRGNLRAITARHLEDAMTLLMPGKSGKRIDLPGTVVERRFNLLSIGPSSLSKSDSEFEPQDGYNRYEYVLPVPGSVEIPEVGGVILAEETREPTLPAARGKKVVVAFDENDRNGLSRLSVRNPRRGDRFRPLGAPGSKSLNRYLMDRHVGRQDRRTIPLVVQGDREVLWVVGHAISEQSRVHPASHRTLQLSWVIG